MLKIVLIFCLGLIETYLYTGWNLRANQRKAFISSVLMTTYMILYLTIIAWALKDDNTYLIIVVYSLSCGVGNFIRVDRERRNENRKKLS